MTAPHAILLVPTEAGAALLAVGDLGAKPPAVWFHHDEGGWNRWMNIVAGRRKAQSEALPLWWDGALVPEGWDRARRVCADLPRDQRPTGPLWGWLHDFRPTCDDVLELAWFLEAAGLCRVVLLDLVDGRLVERAP